MSKFQKKLLIWLIALAVVCPIGLVLPKYFNSGEAWGEWDLKTIEKKTGSAPEGMVKEAELYKAPIPDYKIDEDASLTKQSIHYLISGIIGISLAGLLTFGLIKILGHHEKTS